MTHNSPIILSIEAEIVACEQQLYTAQLSSNELLSDELVFVGPSGEIFTKQMDLELHYSGSINITKLEPKEQEIRCLNGAAVAVTKIFLAGTFQGASFAGDFRYMRIWHHTEKRWRILAGHCSAIA